MDRDVEGDWVLVDKSSATVKSPRKSSDFTSVALDNALVESEGNSYLDEGEDFRGYSSKSSMKAQSAQQNDPLDSIGSFFRRQSTKISKKYEETDFKGGARELGKSITVTSKKAGSKISEGFKEIKSSEKTQKVKSGFFRFASKVKGIFSTPGSNEVPEESKKTKHHDAAKKELGLSDDDEPVPDMLKLDGHSDDEEEKRERSRSPDLSDEEETKDGAISGQSNVVFTRKPAA